MIKIFIVEDDDDIRDSLLYALRAAGFEPMGFECGSGFFAALADEAPDLVVLDIMLPGEDGLSILKRLRNTGRYKALPVIMLTAKGGEYDKIKGLDFGADDYLTKPFGVMELISRIRAVLRRSGAARDGGSLSFESITIDPSRRLVSVNGLEVSLTFKEYELLHYLILNKGIVLSRDKITEAVWGHDFMGESRTVDAHIKSLRQKLGCAGDLIKTVRNVGYKIDPFSRKSILGN